MPTVINNNGDNSNNTGGVTKASFPNLDAVYADTPAILASIHDYLAKHNRVTSFNFNRDADGNVIDIVEGVLDVDVDVNVNVNGNININNNNNNIVNNVKGDPTEATPADWHGVIQPLGSSSPSSTKDQKTTDAGLSNESGTSNTVNPVRIKLR